MESFVVTKQFIEKTKNLTGNEIKVLLSTIYYMNTQDSFGISALALFTGVTYKTTLGCLETLEKDDVIRKEFFCQTCKQSMQVDKCPTCNKSYRNIRITLSPWMKDLVEYKEAPTVIPTKEESIEITSKQTGIIVPKFKANKDLEETEKYLNETNPKLWKIFDFVDYFDTLKTIYQGIKFEKKGIYYYRSASIPIKVVLSKNDKQRTKKIIEYLFLFRTNILGSNVIIETPWILANKDTRWIITAINNYIDREKEQAYEKNSSEWSKKQWEQIRQKISTQKA